MQFIALSKGGEKTGGDGATEEDNEKSDPMRVTNFGGAQSERELVSLRG